MDEIYDEIEQLGGHSNGYRTPEDQAKILELNAEWERLLDLFNTYNDGNPVTTDSTVRLETFLRVGANSTDVSTNLSEDSFYYMLIDNVKSGNLSMDTVKSSMPYMYPALKAIFDDNVLDDNNNIVYFSSEREIPVLRLRFRYTYA
jgi:hypothetical protein